MSTVQLRGRAKTLIDGLPASKLRVTMEFLALMKTRESDTATADLRAIPGFEKSFAKGTLDVRAGRTTPWRKARSRR